MIFSVDMRTRMKPIVYIINNSLTLKYIANMETLDFKLHYIPLHLNDLFWSEGDYRL